MIRSLWVAAALVALFAMHGLAAHAGGHESAPMSMPAASATSTDLGTGLGTGLGLDRDAITSDGHTGHGTALAPAEHGQPGHAMSVLGLCLAIMATAAILLLRLLARPVPGLLALLPRALTLALDPRGARREHSPPDLHALSVLRC